MFSDGARWVWESKNGYIRYKSTVYFLLFENAASAWNAMLANGLVLVVDAKRKNGFEIWVRHYMFDGAVRVPKSSIQDFKVAPSPVGKKKITCTFIC